MLTSALVPMLLWATPISSAPKSSAASTDSVTLVASQLDSLLLALDTYETQSRLDRLALARCQELGKLDSLLFVEYREAHKQSWLTRVLHEPIVWLVVGTYLGIKATE